MTDTISGISVPDSKLAREITEYIRDNEDDLLYHHSRRVFFFGALVGQAQDLSVDHELLYAAAMFHDRGLTDTYSDSMLRFEVDGANAAAEFLRRHQVPEASITARASSTLARATSPVTAPVAGLMVTPGLVLLTWLMVTVASVAGWPLI